MRPADRNAIRFTIAGIAVGAVIMLLPFLVGGIHL